MSQIRDIKVGDTVTLREGDRRVVRIEVGTRDHMRRGNGLARGYRRLHVDAWPYVVTVRSDAQVGHAIKSAES